MYAKPNCIFDSKFIEELYKKYTKLILLGDLNAKSKLWCCKTENKNGKILEETIEKGNLHTINNDEPTYRHSDNIIDLAIVSNKIIRDCNNYKTNDEIDSDHYAFTFQLGNHNHEKQTLYKTNWTHYKSKLEKINTNEAVSNNLTTECKLEAIAKLLINTSDASKKEIRCNKQSTTLPNHIVELIKLRRRLRNQYQSTRIPEIKTYINQVKIKSNKQ